MRLPKSHCRTFAFRLGGILSLAVILLGGCQRKMIYHPARYPTGAFDTVAARDNLKPWLNKAGERIGWHRSVPTSAAKVLIVHGNAGSALDRVDLVRGLQLAQPINERV